MVRATVQRHAAKSVRSVTPYSMARRLVRAVQMKRADCASKGGFFMHDSHRKAAEQHELAATAHRTAAEHNERGDQDAGNWHAERALEHSELAYKLAKEAHNKSGQIVTL
jgi:hypothetical protein